MGEFIFQCDEQADTNGGSKFTVPAGEYALTVWEVIPDEEHAHAKLGAPWRTSKNGDPQLNIKFGINEQGGKLWIFNPLTFIPKGQPGHGIIVHALKTLGAVIKDGQLINFKPSDLLGRVCRAELTLAIPDGGKYPKNKIKTLDYAKPEDKPEMPAEVAQPADTDDVPF